MEPDFPFDRLPAASMDPGSFADVLRRSRPEALPGSGPGPAPGASGPAAGGSGVVEQAPHGTTILALRYEGGVDIAGDRRGTGGRSSVPAPIQQGFPTHEASAVATPGGARPARQEGRPLPTPL